MFDQTMLYILSKFINLYNFFSITSIKFGFRMHFSKLKYFIAKNLSLLIKWVHIEYN